MRIGHGYDVHKLVSGRKLILGGVEIPHTLGLLGHSDADVLLHAICDALFGAMCKGDIGKHFPDTSAEFKDINSMILLNHVVDLMRKEGFALVNLDATIIAQKPKLAPFIDIMRKNIANSFECDINDVNVKATTEEKLGFTGTEKGVSAHCVLLITK